MPSMIDAGWRQLSRSNLRSIFSVDQRTPYYDPILGIHSGLRLFPNICEILSGSLQPLKTGNIIAAITDRRWVRTPVLFLWTKKVHRI